MFQVHRNPNARTEDGMSNQHERERLQLYGFEKLRGQKKFIFTWDWKDKEPLPPRQAQREYEC